MGRTSNLATFTHPAHVTLRSGEGVNRPTVRSILDYLADITGPFEPEKPNTRPPSHSPESFSPPFDVRETKSFYFLEGEFPGLSGQRAISIEKLSPRGILVEARSFMVDLDAEWDLQLKGHETAGEASVGDLEAQTNQDHNASIGNGEAQASACSNTVWNDPAHRELIKDLRLERSPGHLQRSFTFPEAIDFESIKARLKDGLLRIRLPKAEAYHHRQLAKIDVDF